MVEFTVHLLKFTNLLPVALNHISFTLQAIPSHLTLETPKNIDGRPNLDVHRS
eukprot:c36486_g1_i1 orf=10-168(-)